MITRETIDALSPDDLRQVFRWVMSVSQKGRKQRQRKPRVGSISAMAVGDSALYHWSDARQLYRRSAFARKILDDPNAKWVSRTTSKGIRVTRIR